MAVRLAESSSSMTTSQTVFRKQLARIIALPLIVLALAFAVLEFNVRQLRDAFASVDHADVVISRASLLLRSIIDQETGLRAYLLTDDPSFLEPYHGAEQNIPQQFAYLRDAVSDTPLQVGRLDRIQQAYDSWHAYSKEAIHASQVEDASISSLEFNLRGKVMMDSLRQRQEEFIEAEEGLRSERVHHSLFATGRTNYSLAALALLFGLVLLLESRRNVKAVDVEYAQLIAALNKRALELHESRARLEVTLRSIGDAVIVTDAKGNVTFLNTVAEQLTAFTHHAAHGRPLPEIFHIINEDTRAIVESPVEKVVRVGGVVGLANHTILVRPDGTELQIDDSGAPILSDHGELIGVVLVFRDITEQRRTMDALRAAEKLAVAGRLAATIAHEVHNPLDAVTNLFFLVQQSATPEQVPLIELAQQELARVVQVSKNLLGLYRESRTPIPLRLCQVVENVLHLLEPRIREKQIELHKRFASDGNVTGFPAEMGQVFSNLIVNAVEAVDTHGVVNVQIDDVLLRDNRLGVKLTVSDTGHGIGEEDLQKLFHPFFTTKGEKGTGLGLWVSHGIVEKHGGYIDVESATAPGRHGASFSVYLPRSASGSMAA